MARQLQTHEIRIHGVHNTPPHTMLAIEPDEVGATYVAGDDSAAFWSPKPGVPLPDGIATREAYSWGNLTSDPNAKGWKSAGARAAWLLLLPFAAVNVGYWTREVRRPGEPRTRGAAGAALFRVAGLLLTALFVTTAAEIGVALVTWQCYGPGGHCASLPGFLDVLANKPPGRLVAAGTVVPALVLAVLWYVSRKSLQLYEEVPDNAPDTADEGHLLERRRFWSGRERVLRLQRLHLAFGLASLVGVTAWAGWWIADAPDRGGVFPGWAEPWPALNFIAAAVLLVAAGVTCVTQTGDAPEYEGIRRLGTRLPGYLVIAGLVVAASDLAALIWVTPAGATSYGDLPGAGAVPVALTVALVASVLLATTLRTWWQWATVAGFAVTVGVGWATDARGRTDGWVFAVAAATFVVGWVVHWFRRFRDGNTFRGWGGDAPAMLLGIGVLVALVYVTAATLFVADRLNGSAQVWTVHSTTVGGDDAEQQSAVTPPPTGTPPVLTGQPSPAALDAQCTAGTFSADRLEVTCTPGVEPRALAVPLFYLWLAPGLLAALLALIPVVAVSYARRRKVTYGDVFLDYFPHHTGPPPTPAEHHQLEQVAAVRRLAKFSHRAERVAGLCGPATALAVLLAVAGALTGREPKHFHVPNWSLAVGLYALALLALGIVGLGAAMYRDGKARTSVAVVWDLTSFWPRAAHPFGPPCYAERAVPDLAYRVRYRLAEGDRVVLSAHSLGAVLAVATYFRIDQADRSRLGLLTYGTQLRAYFGRLFPAVLGPTVLGHGPLGQARMSKGSATEPPDPAPGTMAGELGLAAGRGRWLSLFRRSDYLGFAVYNEPDNVVDRHTLETSVPWTPGDPKPPTIDSHGDYPRTPEYGKALADLLDRWP